MSELRYSVLMIPSAENLYSVMRQRLARVTNPLMRIDLSGKSVDRNPWDGYPDNRPEQLRDGGLARR